MKALLYSLIITAIILVAASCGSGSPQVTRDDLVDDLYTIKGDVEAYSLMKDSNDYYFVGTLNDRPVVRGTWKADGKNLVLEMDNGTTTVYSFKLENDTLTLNDGEEVYTSTKPLRVSHPEVNILEKLRSDLDLNFSEPDETSVFWFDMSLNGYSISAESKLGSGVEKDIAAYIMSEGFEADPMYVTDVCNGYRTDYGIGEIVVTVCTEYDMESEDEIVKVIVSSAMLK